MTWPSALWPTAADAGHDVFDFKLPSIWLQERLWDANCTRAAHLNAAALEDEVAQPVPFDEVEDWTDVAPLRPALRPVVGEWVDPLDELELPEGWPDTAYLRACRTAENYGITPAEAQNRKAEYSANGRRSHQARGGRTLARGERLERSA